MCKSFEKVNIVCTMHLKKYVQYKNRKYHVYTQ